MRHMSYAIILLLAVLVVVLPVQADDTDQIAELFVNSLEVNVTEFRHASFDGITAHPIYDIEYEVLSHSETFSPGYNYRVYAKDATLVPIFDPATDMQLNYFDALIKPDFRLNEKTAPDFMAFLKAVMPENFFDKADDPIRQVDGQWWFINGTFFDDFKGFVVSVNPDGSIKSVSFNLKLSELGTE